MGVLKHLWEYVKEQPFIVVYVGPKIIIFRQGTSEYAARIKNGCVEKIYKMRENGEQPVPHPLDDPG